MTSRGRAPGGVDAQEVIYQLGEMLVDLEGDPKLRSISSFTEDGKGVVRLSRRHKPSARDSRVELVLTYGTLNCKERAVQAAAKRRGETPVEKILSFRAWKK